MDRKKINFDYGFLSNIDLIINPNALRDYVLGENIECEQCHQLIKRKFLIHCITSMCKCGIGILYPKMPRWSTKGNIQVQSYLFKFIKFEPKTHPEWQKNQEELNNAKIIK